LRYKDCSRAYAADDAVLMEHVPIARASGGGLQIVCGAGGFVLPQAIRDQWMHGRRLAEESGAAYVVLPDRER